MKLFYPAKDILDLDMGETGFFIKPYLPRGSIVLLFGEAGEGKSNLIWNMLDCVQKGESFLGLETKQTNCLLVELDMPLISLVERWRDEGRAPEFALACDELTFNCIEFLQTHTDERHQRIRDLLMEAKSRYEPGLVAIDALREVFPGDLNISGPARQIYDAFRSVFPESCLVFIHHEKKIDLDYLSTVRQLNRASGSKELINNTQVVLQLINRRGHKYLEHLKSQVTRLCEPLLLHIDGLKIIAVDDQRKDKIREQFKNWNGRARDFDLSLGKELGVSDRLIREIRIAMRDKTPLERITEED